MKATKEQLLAWVDQLPIPPDEKIDVGALLHSGGYPSTAKRLVFYRNHQSGEFGIVTNSMGTHLSDEFYVENASLSTFSP